MPPPAHLQIVPAAADGDQEPAPEPATADVVRAHVDAFGVVGEGLLGALRSDPDVDGADLVALHDDLAAAAQALAEARRLVDRLGHNWIMTHGQRGRATIDGVVWRASTSGTATSLKAADRERLAHAFFRDRLAPWLAEQLGEDAEDEASTARLWLSLVSEKLGEVFSLTPKTTALAERWGLDAGTYATPTTGGGPTPTFERAPAPPTPRSTAS